MLLGVGWQAVRLGWPVRALPAGGRDAGAAAERPDGAGGVAVGERGPPREAARPAHQDVGGGGGVEAAGGGAGSGLPQEGQRGDLDLEAGR